MSVKVEISVFTEKKVLTVSPLQGSLYFHQIIKSSVFLSVYRSCRRQEPYSVDLKDGTLLIGHLESEETVPHRDSIERGNWECNDITGREEESLNRDGKRGRRRGEGKVERRRGK